MDNNDTLGICGPAMMAHMTNIRTFGQGKTGFAELVVNLAALDVAVRDRSRGGDNGTDEDMLVGANGIATAAGGGLAGDPTDIVVDHLDVDVTDVALTQYCHDQFYGVHVAWSVPDAFLSGFRRARSSPRPMTPIRTTATTRRCPTSAAQTTSRTVQVSMASTVSGHGARGAGCRPRSSPASSRRVFVTFSPLQFSKATGYDSHGRHVSDQAAAWIALGGNASLVNAVVAQFPPKATPVITPPPPVPTGPATLANAQAWAAAGIQGGDPLQSQADAIANANAGLAKYWPSGS